MKKSFFLALLLVFSAIGYAQAQRIITGTVNDAGTGEPVPFTTVAVLGTTVGTSADKAGNFSLTVPTNAATLVFSSVGYVSLQETIGTRLVINARLVSETIEIEETIILGYGSAKAKTAVTASASTVSNVTLQNRPSANVLDALQGQVAGLQVYTSSGEPSITQSVRLHGIGSLGSSSTPLYVVDGVPIPTDAVISLNSGDFQSVTILKDASATSIYGSRAANGVIYITTKRGVASEDRESVITVKGQYGISNSIGTKLWDDAMHSEQLIAFWEETGIKTAAQTQSIRNIWTHPETGQLNDTRWFDYIFRDNVPTYQLDFSAQGGGKKVTYFISASQFHQEGTAARSEFDRYTVRSNIDVQVKDWMKIGLNLQLSSNISQSSPLFADGGSSNSTLGGLSFLLQPYYSPYVDTPLDDSSMPIYKDYVADYWYGIGYNTYYIAEKNSDKYKRAGLNGSTFIQLNPVENLIIVSRVGLDWRNTRNDWFTYPSYRGSLGNGTVGKSTSQNIAASITNTIEYKFDVNDDHGLTLLVGQEGIYNDYEYYYARSTGQTDDRLMHLENGIQSTYDMASTSSSSKFNSYFGRVNYSFRNRLFADISIRNDASSRFGKENRNATFWAAGVMWNIAKEDFMSSLGAVSGLRLKVSYGTQGNASIGDYAALATVGSTTDYNSKASWALSNPGNPNLKWETQGKLTIAVDAELWKIFTVGIEIYQRKTEDMLMSVPVPYTTGFSSTMKNVGSLRNRGIDVALGADILRAKDYYLKFSTVFNYNSEKVTQLFDEATTLPDGRKYWTIANTGVAYVEDSPVMFYYPIFAGINPDTGEQQWYVPDPDDPSKITKDPSNVTTTFSNAALLQNTGKRRYAPVTGGFSLSGGWKGIDVLADFSYVLGKNLISNEGYFSENPVGFASHNVSQNVLNYWKQPGDKVKYPDWSNATINRTMQFDTHLLSNASFMRLKNIQLSYTLPSSILKKIGVLTGVRVYMQGRNLLTVSNYSGVDPEVDSNMALGRLTNAKQVTGGIEIKF